MQNIQVHVDIHGLSLVKKREKFAGELHNVLLISAQYNYPDMTAEEAEQAGLNQLGPLNTPPSPDSG